MTKDTFIHVAVIGAGAIGVNHIASFQKHTRAKVTALVETSPERGLQAAEAYHIPRLFREYREVLADPSVDVISIALPNFLHAPVALEAISAGKHVLLEKPMATSAADAQAIVEAARAKGVTLMVGQNQRFDPGNQTLKKLCQEGTMGEIYHARAFWMRRSGIPKLGTWFVSKDRAGGGCTLDIGVHMLDLALHLMGDFEVASVSGQTYAKFGPRGLGEGSWGKSDRDPNTVFDVDDFCTALLRMKSGHTVQLDVSWAAFLEDNGSNGVQLFGTEAGAYSNPARLVTMGKTSHVVEALQPKPCLVSENRMAHFIDVLLGDAELFVKPEESLAIQKILEALYQSAATGREVILT